MNPISSESPYVSDKPSFLNLSLEQLNKGGAKKSLHDGDKPVQKITVLSLLRNNANYLPYFFKLLDAFEAMYDCEFEYYFLENDSKDETNRMLTDWIENKEGNVLVYNLKEDYKRTSHGMDHARTGTIAMLRNKLVNAVMPLDSDWTVFIDSDIYMDPSELGRLFASEPRKNGFGMVCGYTNNLHPLSAFKKDASEEDKKKLVSVSHYYDTFAFVDKRYKMFYPNCAFAKCKLCANQVLGTGGRYRIPETEKVVEIAAGFGGFAIIESEILNDKRIRWESMSYDRNMDLSLCEHFLFCDRLRTITQKKIVLLQDVDRIFRTG